MFGRGGPPRGELPCHLLHGELHNIIDLVGRRETELGENFLFDTRNNDAFLFDTEIKILSYMSST